MAPPPAAWVLRAICGGFRQAALIQVMAGAPRRGFDWPTLRVPVSRPGRLSCHMTLLEPVPGPHPDRLFLDGDRARPGDPRPMPAGSACWRATRRAPAPISNCRSCSSPWSSRAGLSAPGDRAGGRARSTSRTRGIRAGTHAARRHGRRRASRDARSGSGPGCTGTSARWAAAVPVLLLDTDLEQNDPEDRAITDRLYGGDDAYRLKQEIVLGIGGSRLLARAWLRDPHLPSERRPRGAADPGSAGALSAARAGYQADGRPPYDIAAIARALRLHHPYAGRGRP